MRVIILAAGQGTRLRPFTNEKPKCMVELHGKPLLHHQLTQIKKCNIDINSIAIVGGYLSDRINSECINIFENKNYESSNMVHTLFCAQEFMSFEEDLIISYGDIVYDSSVLDKLIKADGDVVVSADLDWYKLWKERMENPLEDAETFKITENNKILELGKRPVSIDEVQAQYIGLVKVSSSKVNDFIKFYELMNKTKIYDGQSFNNMYFTSFLQCLIDSGWNVVADLINNKWIEVDSVDDLKSYQNRDKLFE